MRDALAIPRVNPKVLGEPGHLRNPAVAIPQGPRDQAQEVPRLSRKEEFMRDFPSIAESAGYPLLSRLMSAWMSNTVTDQNLAWSDIESSDSDGLLARHLEVAKLAIAGSLLTTKDHKHPSLAGVRSENIAELETYLSGLPGDSAETPKKWLWPVYKIHFDASREAVNGALMQRMKSIAAAVNSSGEEELKQRLKASIEAEKDQSSIPYSNIEIASIDSRGVDFKINELAAALGRFNVHVGLWIEASRQKNGSVVWRVTAVQYQIKDSFDFHEEQELGPWTRRGLGVGTDWDEWYRLDNADFRDFGKKFGLQKAVEVRSEKSSETRSQDFIFMPESTSSQPPTLNIEPH